MKTKLSLNGILFFSVVLGIVLFSYFLDENEMKSQTKPWHMQMNEYGDNLSEAYLHQYKLMDHGRVVSQLESFTGTTVLILVDAWGVPYKEKELADELAIFEGLPRKEYLHKRLMSYTKFAELAEFRTTISGAVYLFNGDSSEYNRSDYVRKLGYEYLLFCQKCSDVNSLKKLDSLLNIEEQSQMISVSLQSSRDGESLRIKETLMAIVQLVKKHKNVRFVIQGTHRPVLVSKVVREKYYAYWVPVVVINPRE